MVKHLTPQEAHLCVEGGQKFFVEGKLPGTFNPEVFVANWQGFIADGRGVIIALFDDGAFGGALGALLCPDISTGDLMAVECFWYMLPGHRGGGIRLLFEFEKWAKEKKALRIAMIHLTNLGETQLPLLYARLGYEAVEVHYVKNL